MRRLQILLLTLISASCLFATPKFEAGKRYHIVSSMFQDGCVTDGATVGRNTPLYYIQPSNDNDESLWILTVEAGYGFGDEMINLYSIRNAKTGQYVVYDGIRQDSPELRRYVSMRDGLFKEQMNEDYIRALWFIDMIDTGVYAIRSGWDSDHLWDIRVDSYCVGTYSNQGANSNQLFYFTDEDGKRVGDTDDITEEPDPLSEVAGKITVDGRDLVYVESLRLYMCTLPLSGFNQSLTAKIGYQQQEGCSKLSIENTTVEPDGNYTFKNVTGGHEYTLSVTNDKGKKLTGKLTFTSLPIVKMYGRFSDNYSDGSISVNENDKPSTGLLNMKAKWRGGITNGSGKHKRNYHVKLKDADGNKLEQKFFGLRNDNSWILEACQVDMSRIRNRVLTDLWNDFSTPPYYIDKEKKALSGSRGQFVELILNGKYQGIYCMTEAIDRKQMKLKKFDEEKGIVHGQLWKSKDWSYAVFMGHYSDNNNYPGTSPMRYNKNSESWDQYYVKYPDFEDYGDSTDWSTLYNAVDFVCTSSNRKFYEEFADYFDMPVVMDYYILMETILATDNHGKNMYFGVYDKQEDKKITFAVWDMDASCGQRWSDVYYHGRNMRADGTNGMSPEQNYATYITNNEHGDYNIFRRLRSLKSVSQDFFDMPVRLRYRDLRQTYLATDSILDRFRKYLAEFKTCGADQREYDRWSYDSDIAGYPLDFDDELAYIEDWFTRRMNYLDKIRFKIQDLPSVGIEDIQLTRNSQRPATGIYTLGGQHIGDDTSEQALHALPSGIYIINGEKIAVGR